MNGNRLDIQASVDLEGLKKLQAHARKASEHFGNDGAVMTRPPTDGVDGPLRRSNKRGPATRARGLPASAGRLALNA